MEEEIQKILNKYGINLGSGLCCHDKRNPDSSEYIGEKTLEEQKDCYCDNCFRGLTQSENCIYDLIQLLRIKNTGL